MTNEQKRANRDYYRKIGICTYCHKEKAEDGFVRCMACRLHVRQYKYKKKYNRDDYLEKRAKRKDDGVCVNCGKRTPYKGLLCSRCYTTSIKNKEKYRKEKNIIPRSEWTSLGLCYCCGKEKALPDKKVCAGCYKTRMDSISKIMYLSKKEKNTEFFGNIK